MSDFEQPFPDAIRWDPGHQMPIVDFDALIETVATSTENDSADPWRLLALSVNMSDSEVGPTRVPLTEAHQTLTELCETLIATPLPRCDDNLDALVIAVPWWAITCRQGAAVAAILQAELPDAVVPNVRMALEFTVFLALMARAKRRGELPAFLGTLEGAFTREMRNLIGAIERSTGSDTKLGPFLNMVPPSAVEADGRWLLNRTDSVRRLADRDYLETATRGLASLCHPGLSACMPYFLTSLTSGDISPLPQFTGKSEMLYLALGSVVGATLSLSVLMQTPICADLIDPIVSRYGYKPLYRDPDA